VLTKSDPLSHEAHEKNPSSMVPGRFVDRLIQAKVAALFQPPVSLSNLDFFVNPVVALNPKLRKNLGTENLASSVPFVIGKAGAFYLTQTRRFRKPIWRR
jgi:hypothetical protein